MCCPGLPGGRKLCQHDPEREAAAQFGRKVPSGRVEALHLRPAAAALHQQADRASAGIDRRKRRVVAAEDRASDRVRRRGERQQTDRGMWNERDALLLLGRKRHEPRKVERCDIVGMDGAAHRPLEPRDVGEVGEREGRLKVREKCGERFAVISRSRPSAAGAGRRSAAAAA